MEKSLMSVILVVVVGIFLSPNSALARGRFTTFTGPRGRSATRSVQSGMTSSGYHRNVTTTGPAGNTYSHSSTTTGVGTGNRTTTVSGPAGNTATRNVQQGVSSSGYHRNVTTTGPAGNTYSHSSTTTGVGTGNRTTTVSGPAGNTATRNVQQGVSSSGYHRNVTTTGPGGNTYSHSTATTVNK